METARFLFIKISIDRLRRSFFAGRQTHREKDFSLTERNFFSPLMYMEEKFFIFRA